MRIVSGIQPTGNLHLGNYLGAIRNWVRMQEDTVYDGERLYFLADLHSITTRLAPADMVNNLREMSAGLLACGVDPRRSIVFNQARVPYHAELCWLLACTARMGWLTRMTQFKEKSGRNSEAASVGLFAYPILQAADVLLYQATHVPVGEDQKQHLELARDIANKFNLDFGGKKSTQGTGAGVGDASGGDAGGGDAGAIFTVPQAVIPPLSARIMSLRDGTAKMSKSDPSDMSRINLTDDADQIMHKIRKAKSDSADLPASAIELTERPEARNLVEIYGALAEESIETVLGCFVGRGFGVFKPALGDLLVEKLRPIRADFLRRKNDKPALDMLLEQGAERARTIAEPTITATYQALGLARR